MLQEFQKDVTVTTRGQLTLPAKIRRALRLGTRRKVRVAMTEDGIVTLRPLPDVLSFYGSLASKIPFDPEEKQKT
jgi:AbrB family looped-hinge helix DNA binding protein